MADQEENKRLSGGENNSNLPNNTQEMASSGNSLHEFIMEQHTIQMVSRLFDRLRLREHKNCRTRPGPGAPLGLYFSLVVGLSAYGQSPRLRDFSTSYISKNQLLTIVGFTLNSATRIIEFRGFLSQFSTNFHEILHTLFSIQWTILTFMS